VTLHPDLTPERWETLTLAEQLGNAGADVGRAIRAREGGAEVRLASNLDRALAQLDLTLADPRWAGHRRREIARAREVVCDLLAGDNVYGSTPASVERWFMAYAVEARAGR
jgi:hypothetical protein